MRSTTSITLAPGWRWMLRITAGASFIQAARLHVLGVVDDVGDVGRGGPARRCGRRSTSVAVLLGRAQLVVGVDRVGAASARRSCPWPGSRWRRRSRCAGPRARGRRRRAPSGWPARAPRAAGRRRALTRPTPGTCEIFCASRVSARSWTCGSGSVFDVSAERQDRRVGRVDLAVDRRRRAGRAAGRFAAALIAACTSCSATSSVSDRARTAA